MADRAKGDGEDAAASIYVCLELDGQLFLDVARVAVVASNSGFTKVVATLIPGELETVVHDQESWLKLVEIAEQPRRAWYRHLLEGYRRSRA